MSRQRRVESAIANGSVVPLGYRLKRIPLGPKTPLDRLLEACQCVLHLTCAFVVAICWFRRCNFGAISLQDISLEFVETYVAVPVQIKALTNVVQVRPQIGTTKNQVHPFHEVVVSHMTHA